MHHQENNYKSTFTLMVVLAGVLATTSCERPTAADYDNPYDERSANFSSVPTLATAQVTQIGALQVVSGGMFSGVAGYPITQKGVCWSTTENLDLSHSCSDEGDGSSVFTSQIVDLLPETQY
jgi:hypothetical protein